ncbi:FIST N-terminal domain-containing protein [Leptolyngbya sp. CCNP1308]|uniref:FIST signal transduction protein n=1 Tax=Leptolyngbya sp. CCNP1308 TaxID=3110255 RepID=UPI002B1EBE77|nr:FIST N-terminal domain-containing protein [Leptolyngbya sp. CCNP1308]MEA5447729.1 FIST N-terminal domain-containing protein [Leptolyngbya sp. CCNP1308]
MTDISQFNHPPMEWANAVSTRPSLEGAVKDVVEQLRQRLTGAPDLGIVFISSSFTSEFARLLPLLQDLLPLPALVGCSGGGIVGMDAQGHPQELEDTPALSLTLARLPGVTVRSFHLSSDDLPDLDSPPAAWSELIGIAPEDNPQFILMADPFSSNVTDLLQGLDFAYPSGVKIGGLASVDGFNRHSGLFCDRTLHTEGLVGVALAGPIVLDTIVAQGCRPIGPVYRVDKAERNILLSLSDPEDSDSARPPLELLQELFETLPEGDRKLAQSSLFIGMAQDSFKLSLSPGDFLIRTLLGVDPKMGAIAVGDRLRPGQRVQFHLRDAHTSATDLETLLQRYQQQAPASTVPAGALMFSCMGRGAGLYNQANFDSGLFAQYLPGLPLGGFFCGGEIGPVGQTTFLHGFTSVFGICRQP